MDAIKLTRCSDQDHQTLEEFYADWNTEINGYMGATMLSLVQRLRAEGPSDRVAWGLTSLARLCLLSTDAWHTPWHVIFVARPGWYRVDYSLPDRLNPWLPASARVTGETDSEDAAVRMILIAMERSGGWPS